MEEGDLHDEARSVLNALFFQAVTHGCQSKPRLCCWVAEDPANGRKNVAFHLNESALFVRITARGSQLLDCWHAIFCVFELGSDPKCGAKRRKRMSLNEAVGASQENAPSDQLVVLLEDDALGHVAVDNVHGEVERLGSKRVLLVDFDEEVD
jgi:hypothetical protein